MKIGERIKQRREELGMTQISLADVVGTTKQNIYKYENGIITNIPSDKIESIASALGVTPSYLMGWDDVAKYLKDEKESGRDSAREKMFQLFGAEHSTRNFQIVDGTAVLLYYHPFLDGYCAETTLDIINMLENLNAEELDAVKGMIRGYIHRNDD